MADETWDVIREILGDDTWLNEICDEEPAEEKGIAGPTKTEVQNAGGWKKLTPGDGQQKAREDSSRDAVFSRLDRLNEDLRRAFPDINQMRENDLQTALRWIEEYQNFVRSIWNLAHVSIEANGETERWNLEVRSLGRLQTQYENRSAQIVRDRKQAAYDAQRAAREAKRQADHEAWEKRRQERKRQNDEWWERQRKESKRRDRQHKRWMAAHLGTPYIEVDIDIDD